MQNQHSAETVISATIAARLNLARRDAGRLSLAAKNLSVIANRIGIEAASLRTLSEFYDEFAQRSIRLSDQINQLSTGIAHLAVKAWRQYNLQRCLEKVLQANTEQRFLQARHAEGEQRFSETREQSLRFRNQLQQSLDDLNRFLQTIKVIAVNSRIEAASLTAYKAQLSDLSKSIETNTQAMMSHVEFCQRQLRELN